ncbi:MAG: hypothetical protein BGO29_05280 [Bacteroidales bacterium 36-12]|jgi:hypothetical protein|nr:MAG: hypothetical protein BGO29_05280 [Bacteroidales bacterium 36-12]
MNLKLRVLDFISRHVEGVRISDMEKPLNEKRMNLGYVTKSLLEEGKIHKINDFYYPVYEDNFNEF